MRDAAATDTNRLQNLWDDREAARLAGDPLELLRYRSNLLGADLAHHELRRRQHELENSICPIR